MATKCRFCKKEGSDFMIQSTKKKTNQTGEAKVYVYYSCKDCNTERMRGYRTRKNDPKIEPVTIKEQKLVTYETHQERVRRLKAALLVPRTTIQAEPETPKEELPIDDFRYDSSEFKRINPNKVNVKTMFDEFGNAIDPGTGKIYE